MELICAVKNYHWGKTGNDSLVAKFASVNSGEKIDKNKTYAELWVGMHPNGPSQMKIDKCKLSDYLAKHPEELGPKVVSNFGNQLPFLFKILSIEQPLSVQAHPTKNHAQKLFNKFPNIYKDNNHKPELAIALSKFEALCGFRPLSEIKYFLKNVPELTAVIGDDKVKSFLNVPEGDLDNSKKLMKVCFQNLMLCDEGIIAFELEKLIVRLEQLPFPEKTKFHLELVKRIYSFFPKDVGVFCIYWLNYLILLPGEALYLAPNEPHAYLGGDCVECMANSDNVVRAGLTPKYRDIQTLCEMLTYKNYQLSEIIFKPIKEDEHSLLYSPPVIDFSVVKICVPDNVKYNLKKRESGSLLLVLQGQGQLNCNSINFGKVFFLPSGTDCCMEGNGIIIFQAFCNI